MTTTLTCIADDLTGAADCAASCRNSNLPAVIWLASASWTDDSTKVVVLDINSRDASSADAVARAVKAHDFARGRSGVIYHKIDTLLRGNWSAEIASVVRRSKHACQPLVIAPAYPELGRGTQGATMIVHGEMRDDLSISAPLSHLGLVVHEVPLDIVRDGLASVKKSVGSILERADVVVCDAVTRSDLDTIAQAGDALGIKYWCGSGGLIRSIAPLLDLPHDPCPLVLGNEDPALIVIGSLSQSARAQAAMLVKQNLVHWIEAGQDLKLLISRIREVRALLNSGQSVLITTAPTNAETISDPSLVENLAEALTVAATDTSLLVLVGGATARALLDAMNVGALDVLGETEPGFTIATTDHNGRQLTVALKPGAFGSRASVANSLRAMRRKDGFSCAH
ncbi:four-carbon acid sugar kinase family protein [Nitratireductor sp. StC3]|uniref:four-carbon acid sugar kinase family protein n=1 Tax=Nitratireductor sp. StC3 TaxID=2126741 RepID=UPI000D0CC458|nr:four-carbon acid sugar kinase family protein [Nitratireductor sp. StC3]PSM16803.1 hypothetical protein C7T96_19230 [Nitratireductor sp. StC3]